MSEIGHTTRGKVIKYKYSQIFVEAGFSEV
jgi:hypothetical protein